MRMKLGRIADIQIGYQVKGRITSEPEGTHFLIQTSNVTDDGEIVWGDVTSFTPDRKAVDRYLLSDGDILFLAKGPRRTASLVRNAKPGTIPVSTFYILRIRDDTVILPGFLVWVLNIAARDDIAALELRGTTMPFVKKESLENLDVDVPSLAIQRVVSELNWLVLREKQLVLELLEKRSQYVHAAAKQSVQSKEE